VTKNESSSFVHLLIDCVIPRPEFMTSIPSSVRQVLQARGEATRQQVDVALLRKQLDAQKQTGDAVNALLEQAVIIQRQLADGHIDVKV